MRASSLIVRFVYFYEDRKIFGILLWTGKEKTKHKDFAICMAESKR